MKKLIDVCSAPYNSSNWHEEIKKAFEELFGSETGRFDKNAKKDIQFRTPKMDAEKNVPYAALIHSSNPNSGGYSGMSFVIFPIENGNPMIAMVIGTQGLSPDEHILGKPGHSRKVNAICTWLNQTFGNGKVIAWAKQEAVRIDKDVPETIKDSFVQYSDIFKRYGQVIYSFCDGNPDVLESALKVFLDLNFEERNYSPLKKFENEYHNLKTQYFNYLMPSLSEPYIHQLLKARKYVIIQGPPGTGKTRLSQRLLKNEYKGFGSTIQFHPNTTYETFIGGLFPQATHKDLGLSFEVKRGNLLDVVVDAKKSPQNYLFIIDEINRADLSKVLGEAIFCLEPYEEREIKLNYDFAEIGNKLLLPPNLHILGTMNTADRSIAILDVAIRRRFAFINLWPLLQVVRDNGTELSLEKYQKLLSIFIEYANEESFALMPGHSYFLKYPEIDEKEYLKTNLVPLLKEYLAQGYVSNFADDIHSYIQELESL